MERLKVVRDENINKFGILNQLLQDCICIHMCTYKNHCRLCQCVNIITNEITKLFKIMLNSDYCFVQPI